VASKLDLRGKENTGENGDVKRYYAHIEVVSETDWD